MNYTFFYNHVVNYFTKQGGQEPHKKSSRGILNGLYFDLAQALCYYYNKWKICVRGGYYLGGIDRRECPLFNIGDRVVYPLHGAGG